MIGLYTGDVKPDFEKQLHLRKEESKKAAPRQTKVRKNLLPPSLMVIKEQKELEETLKSSIPLRGKRGSSPKRGKGGKSPEKNNASAKPIDA